MSGHIKGRLTGVFIFMTAGEARVARTHYNVLGMSLRCVCTVLMHRCLSSLNNVFKSFLLKVGFQIRKEKLL